MPSSSVAMERVVLPFSAIVGHDRLKLALLLNAVNPRIGGLLISGPKGTGKTTIVRSLAALLPEVPVVAGCPFRCNPEDQAGMCSMCMERKRRGEELPVERRRMRVVDLPLSATEDRVVGSLDVERAIREGVAALRPGILAEANQNILYVDEVNLLPDHIVDALLDAAATGVNVVEREGVSVSHPARFIFIGSMNPEEGELRPQLLDRFPLHVSIDKPFTVGERVDIMRRNLDFDRDAEGLRSKWRQEEEKLRREIVEARRRLDQVRVPDTVLQVIAELCFQLGVDGVRPDIVIAKAAMAHAALQGRDEVTEEDVEAVAPLALSHRTRQRGVLEPPSEESIRSALKEAKRKVKKLGEPEQGGGEKGEKRRSLLRRFRHFYTPPPRQEEEVFDGKPPRWSKSGTPRCAWTFFVLFYIVLAGGIFIYLSMVFPLLAPLNLVVACTIAAALLKLLEKVIRRIRKPGSILPTLGTPEDSNQGTFRRTRQVGPPHAPVAASTPKPPKKMRTPPPTSFKPSRPQRRIPSLISLEEGRPLFTPEDLYSPPFFSRHRMPKWSLRQIWRHSGSASSQLVEGGALRGSRLPRGAPRTIHLPASITAASHRLAMGHQPRRATRRKMLAVRILPQDVREKRFFSRSPLTIIFVVDLSISMTKSLDKLKRSLLAFKACLEGTRDRVGLVALKDWGAAEVQSPTTNWTKLMAGLMSLHVSGFTPLAAGLARALETIKRERRRNPGVAPLVILFSDFMPNIRLGRGGGLDVGLPQAIADVLHQCRLLAQEGVPIAAINLHHEFFPLKGWSHHEVIERLLRQKAKEMGTTNLLEVGLRSNLFIPFLAFYVAYLTGGRVFLGDELTHPEQVVPVILSLVRH